MTQAIGIDPVGVVATMARITRRAGQDFDDLGWTSSLSPRQIAGNRVGVARLTAATTAAGWRAAVEEGASGIVASTPVRNHRALDFPYPAHDSDGHVHAVDRTARQLSLSWCVRTLIVGEATSTDEIVWFAMQAVVEAGHAQPGEVVVVLAGSPLEPEPATDTTRPVRIR